MSNQNPRRPASSRTSTPRPRKIAGRAPDVPDATETEATVPDVEAPTRSRARSAQVSPPPPSQPSEPSEPSEPRGPGALALFAGERLTKVLLVGLAVLVLVVAGQGVWFAVDNHDKAPASAGPGTIVVPPETPVQMNQSDIDQGVDQAAKDVVTLMSLHYKTFDADVAKAVDLTTSDFAPKYKQTTADLKDEYAAKQVDLSAKVIGQGVVKANTTRLQALLFVNQWATRGVGKQRRLVLTSFRVLMTMVHTNTGWLVDGMDTQ